MPYTSFFEEVTGNSPYPYQKRLGEEQWPDLLDIPTGLGKTAAVVVAWLWKRLKQQDDTPRRLVYCLPMRVLVEQTHTNVRGWLDKSSAFFKEKGLESPSVYLLMGGEVEDDWELYPEKDAILIGTQDMLLSRALMRGYGMSRYKWPVHFGLLHNDAMWVYDEVQLMGSGLATSAQLEAFRKRFSIARSSRSLWVSATLNPHWLDTVDMRPHLEQLQRFNLSSDEQLSSPVQKRCAAPKRLDRAFTLLTSENQKQSAKTYADSLAKEILAKHVPETDTLVILNTVERAQAVLNAIDSQKVNALKTDVETLLIHSRFRSLERQALNNKLAERPTKDAQGRIIVATQAVEAGVDMTSRVLFTELAPWSSLVQRFGRCNRYGEANDCGGADILWIDFEKGADLEAPYDEESIADGRVKLLGLRSASSADLPTTDSEAQLHAVLRAKDFRDLFSTDPDLSGFDIDISQYIRDADALDVQVFWRDLSLSLDEQPQPQRTELCRASLSQIKTLLDRMRKQELKAYRWDSLDGQWRQFRGSLHPGLVLMLDVMAGGYSERFGFMTSIAKAVTPVEDATSVNVPETYGDDWRSQTAKAVELSSHLVDAEDVAEKLCNSLGDVEEKESIVRAARWHDVGKAHPAFQSTMYNCQLEEAQRKNLLLAKSASYRRHQRKYFRHELASMLSWLEQHNSEERSNLIAYLIVAHHGKVRISLRAMPEENEPVKPYGPRFARGVWEGEELPGFNISDREAVLPIRLRLDLMELGEGEMGPSWTTRTQRLLDAYGPFRLAWMESLVRIADWRASGAEQEEKP